LRIKLAAYRGPTDAIQKKTFLLLRDYRSKGKEINN
jgi:hypothetical protein